MVHALFNRISPSLWPVIGRLVQKKSVIGDWSTGSKHEESVNGGLIAFEGGARLVCAVVYVTGDWPTGPEGGLVSVV